MHSIFSIAVLFSVLPLIGCVDKGESDTSSGGDGADDSGGETGCVDADGDGYGEGADCTGTDCDESDATVWEDCSATGDSDLVFTLHFDARQSDWTATGCILGAGENTIGCDDPEEQETLVIMLCTTSDTTCESPVLIRAVTAEENEEGILVQDSFGADMRVSSLPAGDWLVMLMIDSAGSIGNGAAWTDDFGSIETAWGGVASTGDVLLTAAHEEATSTHNPTPTAWAITLTDGAETSIGEDPPRHSNSDAYGSVWLSHAHTDNPTIDDR